MSTDLLSDFDGEHWVALLRPTFEIVGADKTERYRVGSEFREAWKALKVRWNEENLKLTVQDGVTLIRIIGSEGFEEEQTRSFWELSLFMENFRHDKFIETIELCYPDCPLSQRGMLICILASYPAEQSASVLKRLIAEHGFYNNYPRVFWKFSEHTEGVKEYIVEYLRQPKRQMSEAVNLINLAIEREHLDPCALNVLANDITLSVQELMGRAKELQASVNRRWSHDEDYWRIRHDLGAWLDLVGIVPECDTTVLHASPDLEDPLINLFIVCALAAKGQDIPETATLLAANSYETVRDLHQTLKRFDLLELFPKEFSTFEHFAAGEMVGWLLHPSELGEEPKEISLELSVDRKDEEGNPQRWCLWRFTDHEGESFAGVSGPYNKAALDEPSPDTVRSNEVFSNFTPWQEATAEEHLGQALGTIREWRSEC